MTNRRQLHLQSSTRCWLVVNSGEITLLNKQAAAAASGAAARRGSELDARWESFVDYSMDQFCDLFDTEDECRLSPSNVCQEPRLFMLCRAANAARQPTTALHHAMPTQLHCCMKLHRCMK